jgi:alpha-galactosidase
MNWTRREVIELALASPPSSLLGPLGTSRPPAVDRQSLIGAPAVAIGPDGAPLPGVDVLRDWSGAFCRSHAVNSSRAAVRVKEVVLFDVPLGLPPETSVYGEGFQMLTQTGGTLGSPLAIGNYTDASHYKIPVSADARAFYGLLALTPPGGETRLLAFTSCGRFAGRFELHGVSLRAVLETEGLEMRPGETWPLEELTFATGRDRARLFAGVADRLASHHPPLHLSTNSRRAETGGGRAASPPTGWCSWYCFGAKVTAQQVLENLDVIAKQMPALRYIQIDDGYQSAMGDWLETGTAFGGNVRTVLDGIRRRGFEPAIWVAPFIAEAASRVFQQHPDWFIKDADRAPLRADTVTFGGWRNGPWYALDGTHPEVQRHFEQVFRTMRRDWGCTYFKLDANFWGAMHGGRFHDSRATRVEAYRRGMQAVRRGAGDAFLLGCNHPIWPSIGVIHGSRSSNDIKRSWDRVATTARQNLNRNWQNGRLWWNDPDAVCLTELSDSEVQFHATAIYATGGMILSGDDLTSIPGPRLAILRKLLPPTGVAAAFEDASLRVGVVDLKDARMLCLFNWDDGPATLQAPVGAPGTVTDFWSDESLGRQSGVLEVAVPPRSARLLRVAR